MTPQKQRHFFNDGRGTPGDCHRTCIAMILDLDRDEVPHFMQDVPYDYELTQEGRALGALAEQAERDWLAERCLVPVHWGYVGSTDFDTVLETLSTTTHGTAVIIGCTSNNGCNHSVVYHEGRIYNPSNGDISGPMQNGFWYITVLAHATKPLPPESSAATVATQED